MISAFRRGLAGSLGSTMVSSPLATSGTYMRSPPQTRAEPMTSPASNSFDWVRFLKPHSIRRWASTLRSSEVCSPMITSTSRRPSCTAEPTRPYPASLTKPVFMPSAPTFRNSSGLRLMNLCRRYWNSFCPNTR